jgi:hypothetical protein
MEESEDTVLVVALEQMEYQRVLPGDRRRYLTQYFGFTALQAEEAVMAQTFEMGQPSE